MHLDSGSWPCRNQGKIKRRMFSKYAVVDRRAMDQADIMNGIKMLAGLSFQTVCWILLLGCDY